MYFLTVLEARSPKARYQQGRFFLSPVKKSVVHASLLASGGWLGMSVILSLVDTSPHLCLHLHLVFCGHGSVSKFPF